jgi:Tfp pilus assembly protein PilF
MLKGLPQTALPFGVYWVGGSEPQGVLRPWLEERDATWVEKFDYDEFMLLIRNAFDLPHPTQKPFETVFQKYAEKYQALSGRILLQSSTTADSSALKEAVKRADRNLTGWIAVHTEAQRVVKSDPDLADSIYKSGLEEYPKSAQLLGSYAVFLTDIRKDNEKAEEFYRRSLELDPNNAINLSNYAVFLRDIRKDNEKAEEFYRLAIEADPNNAINLGNYANFLTDIRKDNEKAEEFYRRSLELNPNNAVHLGNYAVFLRDIRKDNEKAEEFYRLAIEADPNNAINLGNYANFLKDIRKDNGKAEEFYRRAIEADPNNATNLGNYAGFLLGRGRLDEGNKMLEKAFKYMLGSSPRGLVVELWFYAYAHWPVERRKEALKNLKQALVEGQRSPGWDLSKNVTQAKKGGHPDADWLQKLADVVTDKADISVLKEWPTWENS